MDTEFRALAEVMGIKPEKIPRERNWGEKKPRNKEAGKMVCAKLGNIVEPKDAADLLFYVEHSKSLSKLLKCRKESCIEYVVGEIEKIAKRRPKCPGCGGNLVPGKRINSGCTICNTGFRKQEWSSMHLERDVLDEMRKEHMYRSFIETAYVCPQTSCTYRDIRKNRHGCYLGVCEGCYGVSDIMVKARKRLKRNQEIIENRCKKVKEVREATNCSTKVAAYAIAQEGYVSSAITWVKKSEEVPHEWHSDIPVSVYEDEDGLLGSNHATTQPPRDSTSTEAKTSKIETSTLSTSAIVDHNGGGLFSSRHDSQQPGGSLFRGCTSRSPSLSFEEKRIGDARETANQECGPPKMLNRSNRFIATTTFELNTSTTTITDAISTAASSTMQSTTAV